MAEHKQNVTFKWAQGEDLRIDLIYKEGDNAKTGKPVPLSSGYALRMDIVSGDTVLETISSSDSNVVLSAGGIKTPNISIVIPRGLALPNGVIHDQMGEGVFAFAYDIFLRNTATNVQSKILKGAIIVEESHTLWQ